MAANCFYLIGRNQIYFDEITVDEFENTPIGYDTLTKAIWYTWLLTLGEFDYGAFWLGNQQSAFLLVFFFTASTFMMIIHLLNMLIAIMGNTYMSRNEVAHNIRSRDHLKFVIENWELNQYFENRDKLKYIVTAYKVKELQMDQEAHILNVTDRILSLQQAFNENQQLQMKKEDKINIALTELTRKIDNIEKKVY
jgi:hypothetical protein